MSGSGIKVSWLASTRVVERTGAEEAEGGEETGTGDEAAILEEPKAGAVPKVAEEPNVTEEPKAGEEPDVGDEAKVAEGTRGEAEDSGLHSHGNEVDDFKAEHTDEEAENAIQAQLREEQNHSSKQATAEDAMDSCSDATTSDTSSDSDSSEASSSEARSSTSIAPTGPPHVSCIQELQLSPDGTCIFTSDYDRTFSVYATSSATFKPSETQSLTPYAQARSADPLWAFAANPCFDLNDSTTTLVLISRRNQYITLHNALWDISRLYDDQRNASNPGPVNISNRLASYKLVDHLTEDIRAPLSLAYSPDGQYFYAGSQDSIAIFDMDYTDEPISKILTIPSKRNKMKGGGRGFKGYISALSVSPEKKSLLAAGARTRNIGVYDAISGKEVTAFALPGSLNGKKVYNPKLQDDMGEGVTQLKWSPCGNYLYVAERNSDALLIYDARRFGLTLGHCAGRNALTKQKLGFDLWTAGDMAYVYWNGEASHEIWAGGMDGKVRVWRDPWKGEGALEADEVVDVGEDPIVGVGVHREGSLAAVASGRRMLEGDDGSEGRGRVRGGGRVPKFREWGCLDILGLASYQSLDEFDGQGWC